MVVCALARLDFDIGDRLGARLAGQVRLDAAAERLIARLGVRIARRESGRRERADVREQRRDRRLGGAHAVGDGHRRTDLRRRRLRRRRAAVLARVPEHGIGAGAVYQRRRGGVIRPLDPLRRIREEIIGSFDGGRGGQRGLRQIADGGRERGLQVGRGVRRRRADGELVRAGRRTGGGRQRHVLGGAVGQREAELDRCRRRSDWWRRERSRSTAASRWDR